MNPALPPQLRENLDRAGSPARWFRPSVSGESVRPEVVDTLLSNVLLTAELVPVVVREAKPEGPVRRKALEIALRQRVAASMEIPQIAAEVVALQSVPESAFSTPAVGTERAEVIDLPAPSILVDQAPPTDPFDLIGDPTMNATTERAVRPLSSPGTTSATITPPAGAASHDELVGSWLQRQGMKLHEQFAPGVRQRIATETGLTDDMVKTTMTRLRKAAGVDLRPRKGGKRGPVSSPRREGPKALALPVAAVPVAPDLESPEEQRRGLVVGVCARLLAGERDETLLLVARLLERGL